MGSDSVSRLGTGSVLCCGSLEISQGCHTDRELAAFQGRALSCGADGAQWDSLVSLPCRAGSGLCGLGVEHAGSAQPEVSSPLQPAPAPHLQAARSRGLVCSRLRVSPGQPDANVHVLTCPWSRARRVISGLCPWFLFVPY